MSKVSVVITSPEAGPGGARFIYLLHPKEKPLESPWLLATLTLRNRAERYLRIAVLQY